MFSIFKPKKAAQYFSAEEQQQILQSIRQAEKTTSGEIRVFIENRCRFVDALDRAKEIFEGLKMEKTENHNAVLMYVAVKDRQLAIYGDNGIAEKVGQSFWDNEISQMIQQFNKENYAAGISKVVLEIGQALHTHFPYDSHTDKNELPDDIVFGK